MSQSKRSSILEALVNTFVGLIITIAVSPLIYYSIGVKMSLPQMSGATLLFTFVSIARNYIIRRWFNNFGFRHTKPSRTYYGSDTKP